MALKTISTYNGVTQAVGVGVKLIITSAGLPTIQSIKGYCNGTANTQYFLQFFNLGDGTTPANGSVPLLSLQVLGGDGFIFNDKPLGIDSSLLSKASSVTAAGLDPSLGLTVYLSTTEATLTIGTGGVTMDIAVEIESGDYALQNETRVAGTAVQSLAVASDPSVKKLTRFAATNGGAGVEYLMLFGYASPTTGATPVQQWPCGAGLTINESFGNGFFVTQGKTDYTIHTGLYLYASSTTQTFTASVSNWNITGYYTTQ